MTNERRRPLLSIVKEIREITARRGLKQQDLAAAMGTSSTVISWLLGYERIERDATKLLEILREVDA